MIAFSANKRLFSEACGSLNLLPSIRLEVALGFADQMLISAMNFSIGLFFINFAPKDDYGFYSIAFASILFITGLSNAVITTQMTVNAADRPEDLRDAYCYEMLLAQVAISLPAVFSALCFVWLLCTLGVVGTGTAQFMAAVAFSCLGVLLHEFFRRLFYLRFKPQLVLLLDLVRILLLGGGVCIFLKSGLLLDFHFMMIAAYGLSACATGYIGYKMAWTSAGGSLAAAWKSLSEAWAQGKWATAGVSATWLQNQSYTYLLALLCGPGAIADANAARLFFAPIAMLTTSYAWIFMPKLSLMRGKGEFATIADLSKKTVALIVVAVVCYSVLVFSFKNPVLDNFFPSKYRHITPFIGAWMLYFLFQAVRTNSSVILQVLKKFKIITISSVFISLGVIAACVVLIHFFGVLGNILGMAAGEMVLAIVLWRAFDRFIRSNKS